MGHMLWIYDGSLVFLGNLGPEFLLSVPRLSALTTRGDSGTPSTTAGIYSFVLWPQLDLGVFPFGSYVRASLLLLYFWGSPCVPCIPLFLFAHIGCGAAAKWFIAPVCAKPPSTLSLTDRSVSETRPDFVSG